MSRARSAPVSTWFPLSSWFREIPADDAPVAFGRQGERSRRDLVRRVAGVTARVAAAGGGRWLVYSEDSFAFTAALLGLLGAGARAVLPPNAQPGTLARLASEVDGALVDAALAPEALLGVARFDPLAEPSPPSVPVAEPSGPPKGESLGLELHTSGTTGDGKPVPKGLRHLEAELEVLEARFGPRLSPRTRVFATVSHQHLYGLLFRVLWPLAAGRPFCRETPLHFEESLAAMDAAGEFVLVTTPAHLRRLAALDGIARRAAGCRAVFSSGGPLDAETAARVAATFGEPPIEIFGSTETGGVAWRRQSVDRVVPWTPLPRVETAREATGGRLVVRSPFVSVGEVTEDGTHRVAMGDRIELRDEGRFVVLGRVDRVVKVGEKRVDLPEMESQLRGHPLVADAALAPVERRGRTRLGAVLVLSAEGETLLRKRGRRAVATALGAHLAACWDRVLLPRIWRTVSELPRDAQGKTSVAALRGVLDRRDDEPVIAPETEAERRGELRLERRLRVPPDLAFFDGHFPGRPVVAGVVQISWALEAASAWLGAAPRIVSIEALKFTEVLGPGQAFQLVLELSESRDRLAFRLVDGERVFSSGRCRLAAALGAPS